MAEEAAEKKEKQLFQLDDGKTGSRSAYIRQEFMKNRSRKEIADELKVPYGIVHSATANMTNDVHDGSGQGGRAVMVEWPEGSGEMKPRREVMRELFNAGVDRREIAKKFQTAYGTVYQATKDLSETSDRKGGKVTIEFPEGSGTMRNRIDVIRELWASGDYPERRAIADLLHCDYSIVWMATRPKKAAEAGEDEEADLEDVDEGEESEDEDGEEYEDEEPNN